MPDIVEYRTPGTPEGHSHVGVDRSVDRVVITVDLGEAGRLPVRSGRNIAIVALLGWAVFAGMTLAGGVSGKQWVCFATVIWGGAAVIVRAIVTQSRRLRADPWWRFTASPEGLLVERHNRDGSARWETFHRSDDIADVAVEQSEEGCRICVRRHDAQLPQWTYLDAPRREAETIVNAIREGLRR